MTTPPRIRAVLLTDYAPELIPEVRPYLDLKNKCRTAAHYRFRGLVHQLAARDDVEVHVVTEARGMTLRHVQISHEGAIFHFLRREPYTLAPYYLYLPGLLRVRRLLHAIRPDVVTGFGTEQGYGLQAALSGFPSVIYLQGILEALHPFLPWSTPRKHICRTLESLALRHATGFIAESQFAADWAQRRAPGKPIAIIPNALQPEYLNAAPATFEPIAWQIGELSEIKNPLLALRAFAEAGVDTARIGFAGEGPLRPALEQLAATLNVQARCEMPGWLPAELLRQRLQRAACLVLTSRMDTSPNVIVEAHALGLPVIATAVGGIPSRIRDGVDGFLIPPESPTLLAQRLRFLLTHPEEAQRMGAQGRSKVREQHALGRVAALHADFCRQIASTRTRT